MIYLVVREQWHSSCVNDTPPPRGALGEKGQFKGDQNNLLDLVHTNFWAHLFRGKCQPSIEGQSNSCKMVIFINTYLFQDGLGRFKDNLAEPRWQLNYE